MILEKFRQMAWPDPVREIYARKGEIVTCENGHPICEFAATVFVHERQQLDWQLINYRQRQPVVGELHPRCEKCGGEFYKAGGIFHIGDQWRDPLGVLHGSHLP